MPLIPRVLSEGRHFYGYQGAERAVAQHEGQRCCAGTDSGQVIGSKAIHRH